jgi:hypothetical protein
MTTIDRSLEAFDAVVAEIETCRAKELLSGSVLNSWMKNATDENTCKACDSRTYCDAWKSDTKPALPATR